MRVEITTCEFLESLKQNNYREWFHENKKAYELAKSNFIEIVSEVIERINEFDPSLGYPKPSKCIFRIARDTRFSNNKEPYKNNFGASINSDGRTGSSLSSYYIHIEPQKSFVACGVYMPQKEVLKAVREAIDYDRELWISILNDPKLVLTFGGLSSDGGLYARVPLGFDKESEVSQYLKHKHFFVYKDLSDEEMLSDKYIDNVVDMFKIGKPINDFLNKAIREL